MYLEQAGLGQHLFVFISTTYFTHFSTCTKKFTLLWMEMKKHPFAWLGWGTLAGIGFYSLLSFSSLFGPSWLIAGTWQVTILAGALISPLFYVTIQTADGNKK
ncbi:multidrug resistance efflux transporter family protein [Priestia megaterium]